MEAGPPASPSTSGASTPSSPAASSPVGTSDSSPSPSATGIPEHAPPRRRLVKASSIITKREGGASGAGTGPPGFGLDRSLGTSPATPIGTGTGPDGSSLGVPSLGSTNSFRERAGIRPIVKGDLQGDYPMFSPYGPGGTSGPGKLGRPPFSPNSGIMGDIRPLGRRPEIPLQRRHEPLSAQKHAPEDLRIQQAKRASLSRAQSMGATGNYKSFDSPFGNHMVPVIPNHLFNKTPASASAPTSPSNR